MTARGCAWIIPATCLAAIAGAVLVASQDPPAASGQAEFTPPPAPLQPLPFSHKTHAAQGLACAQCHALLMPDAERETLPATGVCMTCHAQASGDGPLGKLAAAHRQREPIAWVPVYRVPPYVFFSHQAHLDSSARITCETCHGVVGEMEATRRAKDLSMPGCVDCHKATGASTGCAGVCHGERG